MKSEKWPGASGVIRRAYNILKDTKKENNSTVIQIEIVPAGVLHDSLNNTESASKLYDSIKATKEAGPAEYFI